MKNEKCSFFKTDQIDQLMNLKQTFWERRKAVSRQLYESNVMYNEILNEIDENLRLLDVKLNQLIK